jgi:protein SCO1/2
MDSPSKVPLLAVVVGAVMAIVLALGILRSDDEPAVISPAQVGPFRGGRLPDGVRNKPAHSFRLADARGGTTGTGDLAGRPYALTFLYTHCPDVCPLIGAELRRALELLGPRAREAGVLAVSVDPKGDTPAAVRAWLSRHRLPRNFHYLVGSAKQLRPVWDAYYAAPQTPGRPESSHTASIWLIDRDGRIRTKFSGGVPVAPKDIAHDFEILLNEEAGAKL